MIVFLFDCDSFISVEATSFLVRPRFGSPGLYNVFFETDTSYVAVFPLEIIYQIKDGVSCHDRVLLDNGRHQYEKAMFL